MGGCLSHSSAASNSFGAGNPFLPQGNVFERKEAVMRAMRGEYDAYTEEEFRQEVARLQQGTHPMLPRLMPVQVQEPGKTYLISGSLGVFSNTPPSTADFFKGKMSNDDFVELINMINEKAVENGIGLPKMNTIAIQAQFDRENRMTEFLHRATELGNDFLAKKGIHATLAMTNDPRQARITCTITFANVNHKAAAVDAYAVRQVMKAKNKKYAFMVSHSKADAAAEAVLFHETFVQLLGIDPEEAFLDSNDLKDVRGCAQAARDSLVLILLQTKSTLSRPWVLAEIYSANDAGTIIMPVVIQGKGYDFEESKQFLKSKTFAQGLEDANPGCTEELARCDIDVASIGPLLASFLPYLISKPLNFSAPREAREGMFQSILALFMENIQKPQ